MFTNLILFDVKTLLGALVWGYFASGIIACLYRTSGGGKASSVFINSVIGTRFLYAAAFSLVLMRGAVPDFVSINIGNTVFYVCAYIEVGLLLSLSNIYGKKIRIIESAILAASVLSFNIFELYNDDPALRLGVSAINIFAICILPVGLLFFSKQTDGFIKKVSVLYFVLLCALIPQILAAFLPAGLHYRDYYAGLTFTVFIIIMTINTVVYLLFIKQRADRHVEYFNTVVSTLDAGVIVVDENFVITDFNPGAEKLLGYKPHEVLGRTPDYYTPEEYRIGLGELREDIAKGRRFRGEVVRRHKDGRLIHCSAYHFPILDEKGRSGGVAAILRDVTEKKRLELALEEAARAAVDASKAKSTFLANMSHEIRTPLNGVIGFAELVLDDESVSDKTKVYLNKIKSSAGSLLDIVNNILDISKIESRQMELEKIPFDLFEVLHTCKTIIEPKALERGITLFFYSEPLDGRKLVGDPTKIRQVLLNLLSNAVKFTRRGTVKVHVAAEEEAGGRVTVGFEVKDSGIGMSAEQIKSIFEPFARGEDVCATREYGGTGLGLSITKNFVEMMGGVLSVESAPGLGSKFNFTLSFDTVADMGEAPARQDAPPVLAKPTFSGDVLVCEDNHINQEVITNHLLRVGLTPTVAENGKQGLEYALKRLEKGSPYDLILMDIYMPVMDGLQAARKLTEMGNKTPIVALTANALITDRETYLREGMVDCMSKPFTAQELWVCLLKYLKPLETRKGAAPALEADESEKRNRLDAE